MSNTRTFQRRTQREFAAMVRRQRSSGAIGGASGLRPLHKMGGVKSPYYHPAPWGDRRKAPKRLHGFKGTVAGKRGAGKRILAMAAGIVAGLR